MLPCVCIRVCAVSLSSGLNSALAALSRRLDYEQLRDWYAQSSLSCDIWNVLAEPHAHALRRCWFPHTLPHMHNAHQNGPSYPHTPTHVQVETPQFGALPVLRSQRCENRGGPGFPAGGAWSHTSHMHITHAFVPLNASYAALCQYISGSDREREESMCCVCVHVRGYF